MTNLTSKTGIAALAVGFALLDSSLASAQIRPLDDETLREAIAPNAKMPMNVLLPDFDPRWLSLTLDQQIARGPFRVTLITPYYAAWIHANENRRKFLEPPVLSARELNNGDVIVRVEPTTFTPPGTLETVVVKRGDVITRPLREARMNDGAAAFLFRFGDFAAELGQYRLICITGPQNIEFVVSNDAIYNMK